MGTKSHIATHALKNLFVMIAAALFVTVLAGCAGAGTKTGEYVDDSTITTKVKTALATDKNVSAVAIHVETSRGNVRLSGFVKSSAEKQRAGEVARSIAGVTGVTNALVVGSD